MARQSTAPVTFSRTTRRDTAVTMSSSRAGIVHPVTYFPLLAGDSASGKVGVDIRLKEMPKPLLNGVVANVQAWFVPRTSHPQYPGRDEYMHARTGAAIKSLGAADRTPPAFFTTVNGANLATAEASDFFKVIGIHIPTGSEINTDLLDAFSVIYNFRLAAHSSSLTRRAYAAEDIDEATTLPPAFWPSSRLSAVVPDYESALVVGALDLDVAAGQLPVSGIGIRAAETLSVADQSIRETGGNTVVYDHTTRTGSNSYVSLKQDVSGSGYPLVFAEMAGQSMSITLAQIDKARTTQAFAKLRTAYAGNDATGFDNDDTIVAHLMQGLAVPSDQFKRPWLLDSKRVPINFAERFATDAANLDASVSLGRAQAVLSINVPQTDVEGVVMVTCEVLPERIDERMADEWLLMTDVNELPNALRDIQRPEPVDLVPNRRVDAKHTTPGGLYGYEPMNYKWNRDFTRLGGDFFQATPGGGFTENRSNIWQTEIVDPTLSETHYLAPPDFPHDVFSDTLGDAYEFVARHAVSIVGLTQIGDVLVENSDDYDAVDTAGE